MKQTFFVCDRTDSRVEAFDYNDDSDDFNLPPEWGEVTVRFKVPNQAFLELTQRAIEIDQQMKQGIAPEDPDEIQQLQEDIDATAAYELVEREFHLTGPQLRKLLEFLKAA